MRHMLLELTALSDLRSTSVVRESLGTGCCKLASQKYLPSTAWQAVLYMRFQRLQLMSITRIVKRRASTQELLLCAQAAML